MSRIRELREKVVKAALAYPFESELPYDLRRAARELREAEEKLKPCRRRSRRLQVPYAGLPSTLWRPARKLLSMASAVVVGCDASQLDQPLFRATGWFVGHLWKRGHRGRCEICSPVSVSDRLCDFASSEVRFSGHFRVTFPPTGDYCFRQAGFILPYPESMLTPASTSRGNSRASTVPDCGTVLRRGAAVRSGSGRDWHRRIGTCG